MEQDLKEKLGCGCPYCGVPMDRGPFRPSRDHMIPESRGGTLHHRNKAIVCTPCNQDKGDLTLREFHIELLKRRDPRASHVARLIEGMNLFLAGRLRIPQVSKAVRAGYPRLQGQLTRGKDFYSPGKTLMVHHLQSKVGCGCPYCGVVMGLRSFRPANDLLTPRSRGGGNVEGNRIVACEPCKDAKGNLTVEEFHMVLTEDGDPRAAHVGRLARNRRAYFEGRLSIPPVDRETRMRYPAVAYALDLQTASPPTAPADEPVEEILAPAMGMM